jgi:hypothetical protein
MEQRQTASGHALLNVCQGKMEMCDGNLRTVSGETCRFSETRPPRFRAEKCDADSLEPSMGWLCLQHCNTSFLLRKERAEIRTKRERTKREKKGYREGSRKRRTRVVAGSPGGRS